MIDLDEMMMMVSHETKWSMEDLEGMDMVRFLKVVNTVKKHIEARNESMKKTTKK